MTIKKTDLSIPASTPVVDKNNGMLTQDWRIWFNKLYNRIGASEAPNNNDLNQNIDSISEDLTSLENRVSVNETNINNLEISVSDNTNSINTINNNIDLIEDSIISIGSDIDTIETNVSNNTDEINTLKSSVIKTITSVGTGISIWLSTLSNNANFKSLQAGTNVTLDNTTDPNTIIISATGGGSTVNEGTGSGGVNSSTIYSKNGLQVNTTGFGNNALGYNTLLSNVTGSRNVAIGTNALKSQTISNDNISIGYNTLQLANSTFANEADQNIAIGTNVLSSVTRARQNIGMGYNALQLLSNSNSSGNLAFGVSSIAKLTSGSGNIAIGNFTLFNIATGEGNIAIGPSVMQQKTSGDYNIAIGHGALRSNLTGSYSTAVGFQSLELSNAEGCAAFGFRALQNATGNYQVGVGANAGASSSRNNITCLGANTSVTGDNQVQLGDSSTTPYAYAALQIRSDERDKIDIQKLTKGLELIRLLEPKRYRYNFRDNYKKTEVINGKVVVTQLENDGSKAGNRFHDGLIAQDFLRVLQQLGWDSTTFQDHKINGGDDVLTLNYVGLIPYMIVAIKELEDILIEQQKEIDILKNKI